MRYLTIIILLLVGHSLVAQQRSLSFDQFIDLVRTNHPLANIADIQVEMGVAQLKASRGAFDPEIFYEKAQKEFKGTNYYSLTDQGLKLPSWFGVEFYTGLEQNDGVFLDPENNTPSNGLYYAGLALPVGRGLFIDKRRADLKKALINRDIVGVDRELQFNELILEAGIAYWDWYAAFLKRDIYRQAVDVANERKVGVLLGAELGDRAAIDTLEATILVQNRELGLQQATLEFDNAKALVSTFLWQNGLVPLELDENLVPGDIDLDWDFLFQDEMDSLSLNHPLLQKKRFKIEQLNVEQRLKREQLKPVVNLKYNVLNEPVSGTQLSAFNRNDFNWGIQVKMPILLRKERGQLKMTNLKLSQEQSDLLNYETTIRYKVISTRNEYLNTQNQIPLYDKNANDYRALLDGERRMFDMGESSLFLINSREQSYIQAQIKLTEVLAKNQKAKLKLRYSLGILNQ